mgnify:FL=1
MSEYANAKGKRGRVRGRRSAIRTEKEPLVSTASSTTSQKVAVFDFGAQYGQLIARRVRDLHVYSEIVPCDITADEVREMAPAAIILSLSLIHI